MSFVKQKKDKTHKSKHSKTEPKPLTAQEEKKLKRGVQLAALVTDEEMNDAMDKLENEEGPSSPLKKQKGSKRDYQTPPKKKRKPLVESDASEEESEADAEEKSQADASESSEEEEEQEKEVKPKGKNKLEYDGMKPSRALFQSPPPVAAAAASEPSRSKKKEKKSNKKRKRSKSDSDSSDSDSSSDSSNSDESGDEDEKGVSITREPGASAYFSTPFPPEKEVDWQNFNSTLEAFSRKNMMNSYSREIDPLKHIIVKNTDLKKSPVYFNFACSLQQQLDFLCEMKPTRQFYPFTRHFNFCFWTPFGVVRNPHMFPHGNKDSKMYPPDTVDKIKMSVSISAEAYAANRSIDVDGAQVDPDQHAFMIRWFRESFDKWVRSDEVWKKAKMIFKMRMEALTIIAEDEQKQMKSKDRKKFNLDQRVRELFMAQLKSPINEKDKQFHINYSHQLFVTQTKKEQEEEKLPAGSRRGTYHAPTEFSRQLWEKPEPFKMKKTGEIREGYKRKIHPVRMYAGITMEERKQMIANKQGSMNPMKRIPFESSHILDGDIVSCLISFDTYDSPMGAGWKMNLNAVCWVGRQGTLDMTRKLEPGLDGSSCFPMAQKYSRDRDFVPPLVAERRGVSQETREEWEQFVTYD